MPLLLSMTSSTLDGGEITDSVIRHKQNMKCKSQCCCLRMVHKTRVWWTESEWSRKRTEFSILYFSTTVNSRIGIYNVPSLVSNLLWVIPLQCKLWGLRVTFDTSLPYRPIIYILTNPFICLFVSKFSFPIGLLNMSASWYFDFTCTIDIIFSLILNFM